MQPNGARWWRFDLHTHTPASHDYGKGPHRDSSRRITPDEWLLDYMRAGIDCVAVTDHNSGLWIDRLKDALASLAESGPDGYRPLSLFPGVEISVHGGIHVLAILGGDKATSDVDSLLGAIGYTGTKGCSDSVTAKTLIEVADLIHRYGGIAIPAHIDARNGLLSLQHTTLTQVKDCRSIFAVEVVGNDDQRMAPENGGKRNWTSVIGSDSHQPSFVDTGLRPGCRYTWIKMGTPRIEGLRLALLDGSLSVKRCDKTSDNPNPIPSFQIESIEVKNAKYMGCREPFNLQFNPWLNAIVGGRGTGKSTIVEFLRLIMRREAELPLTLRTEYQQYSMIYTGREDSGLLTNQAEMFVVYRKENDQFRIHWSIGGSLGPIQKQSDDGWTIVPGDIAQRFPIRLYSQKQIFHLAKAPSALLKVVDGSPEVDYPRWIERWNREHARFLSLRAKAREIQMSLVREEVLLGELQDVEAKLNTFEESSYASVLREYERRRRQHRVIQEWEQEWVAICERLRSAARELVPPAIDASAFAQDTAEDAGVLSEVAKARDRMRRLRTTVATLVADADRFLLHWNGSLLRSPWSEARQTSRTKYESLQSTLEAKGIDEPDAYRELLHKRQSIERDLTDIESRKEQAKLLQQQSTDSLEGLRGIRRQLTRVRNEFLIKVLEGNRHVRIRVIPYGARESVEYEFRRLIGREKGGFERDIGAPGNGGILGRIYAECTEDRSIEDSLRSIKRDILSLVADSERAVPVADRRFATFVNHLSPETLDRIETWFPEDTLDVQYSPRGDGANFRSIHEGSPGQKTAALLAFLLSYGTEPLVLDQPEDDLDNHLIYDLIVSQIRSAKHKRQILVVTHNANIVVNGNAELVIGLAARGGETQTDCVGSLQEINVRKAICDAMEGGREAFERRYRRIALGDGFV